MWTIVEAIIVAYFIITKIFPILGLVGDIATGIANTKVDEPKKEVKKEDERWPI
jgi:hypothetical protein